MDLFNTYQRGQRAHSKKRKEAVALSTCNVTNKQNQGEAVVAGMGGKEYWTSIFTSFRPVFFHF